MSKRVILWDVMDTLVRDPFRDAMPGFFGMTLEQMLAAKHPTAWLRFERGETTEQAFLESFFRDGRDFDRPGFKACVREAYAWIDGIPQLLAALQARGHAMHVLSNYPEWHEWIEERLAVSRYVAWSFVSCRLGLRKPDAAIYLHAARQLGCDPSDCLFIDDRARNCEAARGCGMAAIEFEDGNVARLRATLAEQGWLEHRVRLHMGAGLAILLPMLAQTPVRETDGPRPRAVVLGVQLPGVTDEAFESSLKELERLADTLGLEVIGRVTQRRPVLVTASVVGSGKLRELGQWTGGSGVIEAYTAPGSRDSDAAPDEDDSEAGETLADGQTRATVVLVDHDLSPTQTRNLEKSTGAEVLDRSMLILSIFQRHARTREARMQVEIARLTYLAPRLREANAGQDRQRGGIGGKGAGESALELDRRRIRDRIAELRRDLEIVQREAETRRSRRTGTETSTVALIGYTNAGKSSLMRALTGDAVYVADQLFATLDTTVRVLKPEVRPRILVSDTVGFIKKLPHDLVASFRSTLSEAKDASLLLHLVDGSDPAFRSQFQVTREVLEELGAGAHPTLVVINKADRMSAEQIAAFGAEFPEAVIMSVRAEADVQRLYARIVDFFEQSMQESEFTIPYSQQRQVAVLHERTRVLDEQYDEAGARVRVRAPAAILNTLKRELFGEPAV